MKKIGEDGNADQLSMIRNIKNKLVIDKIDKLTGVCLT